MPVLTGKSCGKQLAATAVMLTALRGLKLKTLSVNPTLGLRGDVRKWFSFQKKRNFFLNVFTEPRVKRFLFLF